MKISKNKKNCFFLMSQGPLDPKIRFIGQKVCSVARGQTHRHESEYRGHPHPFSVLGIFPSAYHQGSVQQTSADQQTYYQKILLNVLHLIASQSVSNRLYDAIHTRRDEQLACMFHWGMLRWYQYLICHSVMVGICCLSGE